MLDAVVDAVRGSSGIAGKAEIADVMTAIRTGANTGSIRLGDDCAAIPDGDGWLLFAMEGFVDTLVAEAPWFAGYCGVVVNVSDITAMGGHPTAVVNAFWSRDGDHARPILEGLAAASRVYDVPIVGGHSNAHSEREQLAVAITGRARRLLTSFDAAPGDVLVAAVDLRGAYREPWPNWDASTGQDPERLRGDLAVLPAIAEAGLCRAAKDISMGGVIGTALMLLECSGVGAVIDIDAVPRPAGAEPVRWLTQAFPSYGFLLAVPPERVEAVVHRFAGRDIACAAIGECDDSHLARLRQGPREVTVRDFRQAPLTGCGPATTSN